MKSSMHVQQTYLTTCVCVLLSHFWETFYIFGVLVVTLRVAQEERQNTAVVVYAFFTFHLGAHVRFDRDKRFSAFLPL